MKRLQYLAIVIALLSTLGALDPYPAVAQQLLPRKLRAPELDGGVWLNTRAPLRLSDLRGKFVILDFWTYCCINCKHILPELKKLEHEFDKNVVVIGVHSPKFAGEQDEQNVRDAIVRYDIEHPVLSDPRLALWRRYDVDTWPSLRIIDPEGYVIAVYEGEIGYDKLRTFFTKQIAAYRRRSKLDETPLRFDLERAKVEPSPLHYPGKVLADAASNRLFIADSSNHRIVVADLAGRLQAVVGQGVAGDRDGSFAEAMFRDPQGMAVDGDKLYVADTENHKIRLIDLQSKQVTTIAGTGEKRERATVGQSLRALSTQLSSPWDLLLSDGQLVIAMAGNHQIWRLHLDSGSMRVLAGNGSEDIIDGAGSPRGAYVAGTASFAQPSGLATDGTRLLIADSEGSSIRFMPLDGGAVGTLVGTAGLPANRLFTFGDRDGPASRALFQHPIGVAYHAGQVFVADTYNNKVRAINASNGAVTTLVGDGQPGRTDSPPRLDEPAGVSVAGERLYIADTNNHLIRVFDLAAKSLSTLSIDGLQPPPPPQLSINIPLADNRGALPPTTLRTVEGDLRFEASVKLPENCKLDEQSPARLTIQWPDGHAFRTETSSQPAPARLFNGRYYAKVPLPPAAAAGAAEVIIKLQYFFCREGQNGFCRPGVAEWAGTLKVAADGEMMMRLTE
ncbi:MAG: redoxin domain-containing protein [Planctomycetales bacterium]|nr:redoxin domain-containing protein [Planctomycetales bacterium]